MQSKEAEIPITFPPDLWTPKQVDRSVWYMRAEEQLLSVGSEVDREEDEGDSVDASDEMIITESVSRLLHTYSGTPKCGHPEIRTS